MALAPHKLQCYSKLYTKVCIEMLQFCRFPTVSGISKRNTPFTLITGNVLIIKAVLGSNQLQNPTTYFLTSLAVADLGIVLCCPLIRVSMVSCNLNATNHRIFWNHWRMQDFLEGGANSQSRLLTYFLPKTA